MPRLTKIYTRKGDNGTTTLGSKKRVPKYSPRVSSYGTVDELSSVIGITLANGVDVRLAEILSMIQNELFHLGSDLCFTEEDKLKYKIPLIEARHVEKLETIIDDLNPTVGSLDNFILPGGSRGAANLHLSRTVCRRAEREVSALSREEKIGDHVLPYLNRLSDLLFVMSRYENKQMGIDEPLWDSRL